MHLLGVALAAVDSSQWAQPPAHGLAAAKGKDKFATGNLWLGDGTGRAEIGTEVDAPGWGLEMWVLEGAGSKEHEH